MFTRRLNTPKRHTALMLTLSTALLLSFSVDVNAEPVPETTTISTKQSNPKPVRSQTWFPNFMGATF